MAAGSKRKRGGAHQRMVPAAMVHVEQEITLDAGSDESDDHKVDIAVEEVADAAPSDKLDDGREVHDEAVLKTI